MVAKVMFVTGLLAFLLLGSVGVRSSAAAPFPGYFSGENVGLFCTVAGGPSTGGAIFALVQVNFDKNANGGITLAKADALFLQVASLITGVGSGLVQLGCALKPSELHNPPYNLEALGLATGLASSFQSYGFSVYLIIDVYLWTGLDFLGAPDIVRMDIFQVNGPNNVTYQGSLELLKATVY